MSDSAERLRRALENLARAVPDESPLHETINEQIRQAAKGSFQEVDAQPQSNESKAMNQVFRSRHGITITSKKTAEEQAKVPDANRDINAILRKAAGRE
jgi:hypothetical protein